MPNSVNREVDRRALVKKKLEVQKKLVRKKGYKSTDIFSVGDKVRVKNPINGRWSKSGEIIEERSSGSASPPASFIVKMDNGTESLRHKAYLKHEVVPEDASDPEFGPAELDPDSMPAGSQSATAHIPGPVEPTATTIGFDWTRLRKRAGRE